MQTSFLVYTTVAHKMLLNLNLFFFLCYPSRYTVNISSPATEEGKKIGHGNEVVYCCGIEEILKNDEITRNQTRYNAPINVNPVRGGGECGQGVGI